MKNAPEMYLVDTDMFKQWLTEKGYIWVSDPSEQVNMIAEFLREGLGKVKEGEK